MNVRKLAAAMRAGASALHLAAEAIDEKEVAADDEGSPPPSDALAKRRADDFLTQNGYSRQSSRRGGR